MKKQSKLSRKPSCRVPSPSGKSKKSWFGKSEEVKENQSSKKVATPICHLKIASVFVYHVGINSLSN